MQTNLLSAEQCIIKEIEDALTAAGWTDGYNMTDEQIKKSASPIFYHDVSPRAASDSKVVIDGVGRTLYLVYSYLKPEISFSGNKPHHINSSVALTIYYTDAYTFFEGSAHAKYLSRLLEELSEKEFIVTTENNAAITSASDREPYIYRKIFYASKIA